MKLPEMPYQSALTKSYQSKFGGYNHTLSAGDGEIYNIMNMTSDDIPVLSSRSPRNSTSAVSANNGIIAIESVIYRVHYNSLYQGDTYLGSVSNTKKTFATMPYYLVVYPDKKVVRLDVKGYYSDLSALNAAVSSPKVNDIYGIGSSGNYVTYYWSGTEWKKSGKVVEDIEASWSGAATFLAKGSYFDAEAENNTIYANTDWGDYLRVGDAVEISGCTVHKENNKTAVIREISNNYLRFYENTFTTDSDLVHEVDEDVFLGGIYDVTEIFRINTDEYVIYLSHDEAFRIDYDYFLKKGSKLIYRDGVLYYNLRDDYDRRLTSGEYYKKISFTTTGVNSYKSETMTLEWTHYIYKTDDIEVYFYITESFMNYTGYFTVVDDVCVFHTVDAGDIEMVRKFTVTKVPDVPDKYESETLTVTALNYYAYNPYNNTVWYSHTSSTIAGKTGKFWYDKVDFKFTSSPSTWSLAHYSMWYSSQLYFKKKYYSYSESAITVKRSAPDLEYIIGHRNRLWGCKGSEIYASKLGDPFNFNVFDGLSTDSYMVDTGTTGDFTGAFSYLGYPLFFKEDSIVKVYGDKPSEYQTYDTATRGVAKGSDRSLCVAGETLYYHNKSGIMAYTGGVPALVSSVFGGITYKNGKAGSDGNKYYVYLQDKNNYHHLFVYDPSKNVWMKENIAAVTGFINKDGLLWVHTGVLTALTGTPTGTTAEGDVNWEVEFADFYADSPNKKGVSKLHIRLNLASTASAKAYIRHEGETTYSQASTEMKGTYKKSHYLPIIPRRDDNFSVKITGTGKCEIYSLSIEYYAGSQL